jgi:hypothetical protein
MPFYLFYVVLGCSAATPSGYRAQVRSSVRGAALAHPRQRAPAPPATFVCLPWAAGRRDRRARAGVRQAGMGDGVYLGEGVAWQREARSRATPRPPPPRLVAGVRTSYMRTSKYIDRM